MSWKSPSLMGSPLVPGGGLNFSLLRASREAPIFLGYPRASQMKLHRDSRLCDWPTYSENASRPNHLSAHIGRVMSFLHFSLIRSSVLRPRYTYELQALVERETPIGREDLDISTTSNRNPGFLLVSHFQQALVTRSCICCFRLFIWFPRMNLNNLVRIIITEGKIDDIRRGNVHKIICLEFFLEVGNWKKFITLSELCCHSLFPSVQN